MSTKGPPVSFAVVKKRKAITLEMELSIPLWVNVCVLSVCEVGWAELCRQVTQVDYMPFDLPMFSIRGL